MSWREIQKTNFSRLSDLASYLEVELDPASRFPLNLPRRLAEKMPKRTLEDPLTRQFVPVPDEKKNPLGFSKDPVQDTSFCKSDKLLQKYRGRALLLTTSACAMHCRYCFRQNYPYAPKTPFEEELKLIEDDPTLHEVILSGGDPLSLSDRDLGALLKKLDAIEHIQLIRFHTRFPIGIPERIDESFLSLLSHCRSQVIFVIHANHARELDSDVTSALKSVQKLGIPVLAQTVLLKGVNDSTAALKELFLKCVENGIVPYYLHQLDRVEGAAHFEVDPKVGKTLLKELRAKLPGYAIPRFVQEIPGKQGKTLIT